MTLIDFNETTTITQTVGWAGVGQQGLVEVTPEETRVSTVVQDRHSYMSNVIQKLHNLCFHVRYKSHWCDVGMCGFIIDHVMI